MSFASTSNSAQARVTTLKPEIKHGTRDFHSFADELGSDNSMDERSDDEDTRRTSIKKGIKVKGSNSSSLKGRRRYSKKSSPHSSVENPLRELLGRDFDIPAFHRKPATSDQPVSPLSNSFSDADEASSHRIIPSPRQQLLRRVVTTPVKKRQASGSPTGMQR
ncbi:hypothetical protein FRC03_001781 [Tulasnella sp. 419]|nr:hypothetical protein FRC03_001781 [Tulasnella sp. 419]